MGIEVGDDEFDELVADALDSLPAELGSAMENVAVVVEAGEADGPLLGLYEGVPLTERGPFTYSGVMPDRITLYRDTIMASCASRQDVVEQVRETVVHEVAHHFGISDERLDELGWA